MSYLPDAVQRFLEETIRKRAPDTILELAPSPCLTSSALPEMCIQHLPLTADFTLTQISHDTPTPALALVVDAPQQLPRVQVQQLLAYLRNAGAAAVLAVFANGSDPQLEAWRQTDFIALGFRRAEGTRELSADYWVYRYDIHDYKITPSWLNARNWANPNRWGRERW